MRWWLCSLILVIIGMEGGRFHMKDVSLLVDNAFLL
jgi:hypothetical protein